ncbi:hypothetical protein ACLX1H_006131 [Fusarium chlamydosporum]
MREIGFSAFATISLKRIITSNQLFILHLNTHTMHYYTTIIKTPPFKLLTYRCTPPKSTPVEWMSPWKWQCCNCKAIWELAVTQRCLDCTNSKYTGSSLRLGHSRDPALRRYLNRYRGIRPKESFDYDYWSVQNDWRRFRSAYNADPKAWERRTSRDLAGLKGAERRVMKGQIEKKRRTEITQKRLERMLNKTHNCEIDCDYPTQCDAEFEASVEGPDKKYPKLPLCGLDPAFGQDVTAPEDLDNKDEILAAYKDQEQDGRVETSQLASGDSETDTDDENDKEDREHGEEHDGGDNGEGVGEEALKTPRKL